MFSSIDSKFLTTVTIFYIDNTIKISKSNINTNLYIQETVCELHSKI